jgi:hypothetical protein
LFSSSYNALTQSAPDINIYTISDDNEARYGSRTLPPALNVDSKLTVVIGIDNISWANLDKMQNLEVFSFHQSNALNFAYEFILDIYIHPPPNIVATLI